MRTFLLTVGVLALLIALAGCGGDDDEQAANTATPPPADTTDSSPSDTAPSTTSDDTSTEQTDTSDDQAGDDKSPDAQGADDQGADDQPAGSDSGDSDAAGAAVVSFFKAMADGDGDTACSLMVDTVRQQVEKGFGQAPQNKGKSCPELISAISDTYPDQTRTQLANLRVVNAQIKNGTGTVTYKSGKGQASVPVHNDDGTWKIGAIAGGP